MRDESGEALNRLNAFLFILHPSALIPSLFLRLHPFAFPRSLCYFRLSPDARIDAPGF